MSISSSGFTDIVFLGRISFFGLGVMARMDLRLAHGRSDSDAFEVQFVAVHLFPNTLLCAIVEEMKEAGDYENRSSQSKSPGTGDQVRESVGESI